MGFLKELRAPKQIKFATAQAENRPSNNDNQSAFNNGNQPDTISLFSFDNQDSNQPTTALTDFNSTKGIRKLFLDMFEGCNQQFKDFDEIVKTVIHTQLIRINDFQIGHSYPVLP